jgi:DNA gyrase subunit A
VAAAFPVMPGDQIMLVTNAGKLIRCPVEDIRLAGRSTRGVTLFKIDAAERVVSVAHLGEVAENGNGAAHEAVEEAIEAAEPAETEDAQLPNGNGADGDDADGNEGNGGGGNGHG